MTKWSETILQITKVCGHTFVPSVLFPGAIVVDLGANLGNFCSTVRDRYNCRCFAVEANPNLIPKLRERLGDSVWNYAVCAADELMTLHVSSNIEGSTVCSHGNTGFIHKSIIVQGRSLPRLLDELGLDHVALLKVDIEGAEIDVLMSSDFDTLRRCDQISVEFHNLCGMGSIKEIFTVVHRLESAGFDAVRFDGLWAGSQHADSEDHLNWLFMRHNAKGLNGIRRQYVRGPVRVLRRIIQTIRRRTSN